jgi:copper resistance protein D
MRLYHVLVFVHVLAALFWLGGMFFLAAVGAPALRRLESPELRARLFHELGVRFRNTGWTAILVLVVTGVWILHVRGVLRWELLSDPAWWSTAFGQALLWKLVLVAIMLTVGFVHDFVVGPMSSRAAAVEGGGAGTPGRAAEDPAGDERRRRLRRQAALLARGNAVAGILLVYWATRLARGG